MDDPSIIELFRQRDERAIAELKQKYGRLCGYVAGNILSQREDTEECINSALFDVWNNIPPECPDDLKTYLCRIVKNKAIDKLKYNSAEKRNPQLTVSLDELSEKLHVSKYHISHLFTETNGLPLHKYIIKKRLGMCLDAILSGQDISAVSENYGFSDYSVFYRAFVKEYGKSPKQYRDEILRNKTI